MPRTRRKVKPILRDYRRALIKELAAPTLGAPRRQILLAIAGLEASIDLTPVYCTSEEYLPPPEGGKRKRKGRGKRKSGGRRKRPGGR
jgi:hypothetical protein